MTTLTATETYCWIVTVPIEEFDPSAFRQMMTIMVEHGLEGLSEVIATIMLAEASIKRLVEPSEVASLVRWLASPDASMVTGASYAMDGGWSAR